MRNFLRLSLILLIFSLIVPAYGAESKPDMRLEEADGLFEEKNFTGARDLYVQLFDEGYYSEEMLYRMAFIYEKLENYPEAIYYLRKAAKEYGSRDTEAKVRQLLRTQRVSRMFTGSFWDKYFSFFRAWGWIIWLGFGLTLFVVTAHFLLPGTVRIPGRQAVFWTCTAFLLVFGGMVVHRTLFVPDRAVIVQDTSFYNYPSYGAKREAQALSPGEMVIIEKRKDIWRRVKAGRQSFWVPQMALREL